MKDTENNINTNVQQQSSAKKKIQNKKAFS